jgi:predicted nucleic acid-binding protein
MRVCAVLAVLRRQTLRGLIGADRARGAVNDLADLPMDIYPTLPLRHRAWVLRENVTAADGLFIALAERLQEPLLTKDQALASAARVHARVEVIVVGSVETSPNAQTDGG